MILNWAAIVGSAVAIRTVSSAAKKRVVLSARKAKCFLTGGLNVGFIVFSEKISEFVLVGRSEVLRDEEEVVLPVKTGLCCGDVDIVAVTIVNCFPRNFDYGLSNL